MSVGIVIAHGCDGVAALGDDLAIDHRELARVDDGGIGDRDDLLVCHGRNGVGEAVAGHTARRAHGLAGSGCELDAAGIQRKSRAGDGVGHDDVPVCSERFDSRSVVHSVGVNDYGCIFGRSNRAIPFDHDVLVDVIGELDPRRLFIEHSAESELEAEIGNGAHLGIIGIILIPRKRENIILDPVLVAGDGILLTAMRDGDIDRVVLPRIVIRSIKTRRHGICHRSVIELQVGILLECELDRVRGSRFHDVSAFLVLIRTQDLCVREEVFKIRTG